MKRFAIGLVIVFILLSLSFFAKGLAKAEYNKINDLLIKSEEEIKNEEFEKAKETVLLAEKGFTKAEKRLKIFINEDLLNEVGLKLSALPSLCSKHTAQDFLSAASVAKTALLHIKNSKG